MERIKKTLIKLKTTPYLRPFIFFIALFIVTGSLVFFVEVKNNKEFESFIDGLWWAIITFSTT
ncbi:MAG: hypothetical protein GY756_16910, partial [bacterium]|nr:hypothetical protein [bacterium]